MNWITEKRSLIISLACIAVLQVVRIATEWNPDLYQLVGIALLIRLLVVFEGLMIPGEKGKKGKDKGM